MIFKDFKSVVNGITGDTVYVVHKFTGHTNFKSLFQTLTNPKFCVKDFIRNKNVCVNCNIQYMMMILIFQVLSAYR